MSVSVTLKSYFYEVLIPSSQKNTSSPIEDILHHVSISFMKKLALYKSFNPRTHTGCDRFLAIDGHLITLFQSTHPHGVRLNSLSVLDPSFLFQSTHPHGVRRLRRYCPSPVSPSFNPRTHTGCDLILSPPYPYTDVSIHAPTRGATASGIAANATARFQSTHPHGVRHHVSLMKQKTSVSIHAPTRGATRTCRIPLRHLALVFQSTHPHGVRRLMSSSYHRVPAVSIHAPTRGATI